MTKPRHLATILTIIFNNCNLRPKLYLATTNPTRYNSSSPKAKNILHELYIRAFFTIFASINQLNINPKIKH